MGVVSVFFNAPVYYHILSHYAPMRLTFGDAMHLYFTSQMIRHVPGRFWGVVYQFSEAREHISVGEVLQVNVDHTMVYLFFNFLVPGVILISLLRGLWVGGILFIAGVILFALGLRLGWPHRVFSFIQLRLLGRFRQSLAQYLPCPSGGYAWRTIILMIVYLVLSWGLYLIAWILLSRAFNGLDAATLPALAASYALAWFIGFISLISPAGLGVRESAFVLISQNFTSTAIAGFLSVFLRLWLIAIDIVLALVGFGFKIYWRKTINVSKTRGL